MLPGGKIKNEVRILKELLKITIDFEKSFSLFEREFLKLIVAFARNTDELLVIALFCYVEVLGRSRRPQVL